MSHIAPEEATVLVVEDNADNMFVITDLLKADQDDGGCGVKFCEGHASGRHMFGLIAANPERRIDLILLDLQIPYEDGYRVLQEIRQRPLLKNTLVVAVTANVMPHDIERVRQAGFDGFIGKPIDELRFPQQIVRVLAGESVWEPR